MFDKLESQVTTGQWSSRKEWIEIFSIWKSLYLHFGFYEVSLNLFSYELQCNLLSANAPVGLNCLPSNLPNLFLKNQTYISNVNQLGSAQQIYIFFSLSFSHFSPSSLSLSLSLSLSILSSLTLFFSLSTFIMLLYYRYFTICSLSHIYTCMCLFLGGRAVTNVARTCSPTPFLYIFEIKYV